MTLDPNGEGLTYLHGDRVLCHPCLREDLGWCRQHGRPRLGCCARWTLADHHAIARVRDRNGAARCSGCRRDVPARVVRQVVVALPEAPGDDKPRRRFRRQRRSDGSPKP
jgi:hypothetical protein